MPSVAITPSRLAELERLAHTIREDVIAMLVHAGHEHRGHPGAALSIVDILTALYFEALSIDPIRPNWPDRDRFVLSKGHGCAALYAVLARRGFFDRDHLFTFRRVDSLLQGHPDMRRTPGIDMTSGSLGHGLAAGVGLAIDARLRRSPTRVCVLLGDGELQEGLVWEAAMAATKCRLSHLLAFVDVNGWQSSGRVADVMPLDPLADKWQAFGWDVMEIDGHDIGEILSAVGRARATPGPTVVLARTIKGRGIACMEDDNSWHQACPPSSLTRQRDVRNVHVAARPAAIARVSERPLASCRAAFGETVLALAREGRDIMVVTSDTCASMGLAVFAREFPDRHIDVGIAEQNLLTVAAGLAAGGRVVFAATYATFASMRALEQLRTFIAHPQLPVIVGAGLSGLSGGIEGVAHLALEDIGLLRCVPELTILNPADASATCDLVRAAADAGRPAYIRLGRDDSPVLSEVSMPREIGRGVMLASHGRDAALLTSGQLTPAVLDAAALLDVEGIGCTIIEFATLKPLDRALVLQARRLAAPLITIEEHSLAGGLGSAVMEICAETRPALVHRIGLPDRFLESGSPEELRHKFGLTAGALAERIRAIVVQHRRRTGEKRRENNVPDAKHHGSTSEQLRRHKRHAR